MYIRTTLLILFGIAILSSSTLADNRQNIENKKRTRYPKDSVENSIKKKQDKGSKAFRRIVYNPPLRGAPSRRVGKATRGQGTNDLFLSVLSPAYTGLTAKAQPILYWYTSKPVSKPFQWVEFVLNSEQSTTPVLRERLNPPKTGGIHKVRLSDYGRSLKSGAEYEWSIALVPDPTTRSYDYVTSGKVEYVEANKELQNTLSKSPADQHAYIFAENGFWYDAIAAISRQIEAKPEDPKGRENLAQLMDQVELPQVAEYARGSLSNLIEQDSKHRTPKRK